MTNSKISMFLMNQKGFYTLNKFVEIYGSERVECVISSKDNNVEKDHYDEIQEFCQKEKIIFFDKNDSFKIKGEYSFAIGWRWILELKNTLIIFHDSLLPKYRGFSPLVSCLINKEKQIGVTALFASEEYDRGNIIEQKSIKVEYPIKIQDAITKVSKLYADLVIELSSKIFKGEKLIGHKQDEKQATYSLWRDESDYKIDWNLDAESIKRFIDAVGSPYSGAFTYINQEKIRILDVDVIPDVKIENRNPGKVIFSMQKKPVVVCGKGLLLINEMIEDCTKKNCLPLKKFRVRFE